VDSSTPKRRAQGTPRLLDVGELERTQTRLLRRLASIQDRIDGEVAERVPKPAATPARGSRKRLAGKSAQTRPATA
jgi:hypothetical protein